MSLQSFSELYTSVIESIDFGPHHVIFEAADCFFGLKYYPAPDSPLTLKSVEGDVSKFLGTEIKMTDEVLGDPDATGNVEAVYLLGAGDGDVLKITVLYKLH